MGSVGEMVWTAERMYARARSLIPNEEGTLELGKLQLYQVPEQCFISCLFQLVTVEDSLHTLFGVDYIHYLSGGY
jgi:hypothetical protein